MRLIIFTDFTLVIVVKKNFQELFGCGVRLSLTRTSRGMHHSPDFLSFKFEVNNAMTVQTFTRSRTMPRVFAHNWRNDLHGHVSQFQRVCQYENIFGLLYVRMYSLECTQEGNELSREPPQGRDSGVSRPEERSQTRVIRDI